MEPVETAECPKDARLDSAEAAKDPDDAVPEQVATGAVSAEDAKAPERFVNSVDDVKDPAPASTSLPPDDIKDPLEVSTSPSGDDVKDPEKVSLVPSMEAIKGPDKALTSPLSADSVDIDAILSPTETKVGLGSTKYYIYHTGKAEECLSIHTIPDRDVVLPQVDDPDAPDYVDDPRLRRSRPGCFLRALGCRRSVWQDRSSDPQGLRRIKRSKVVGNPKYDPRIATAPYYVHRPRLCFHHPPRTLRCGGSKHHPTLALIHSTFLWREWRLEFGDSLARDGVVDGRGVVSAEHGTKDGDHGTLKGYKLRKHYAGETGKAFVKAEMLRRAVQAVSKEKNPPAAVKPVIPEEVVCVKWTSPFSSNTRRYHFTYHGLTFYWKGTGQVESRGFFRPFLRFNHLKLVVELPASALPQETLMYSPSPSDFKSFSSFASSLSRLRSFPPPKPRQLLLATFTSSIVRRKAGRLDVYDEALEKLSSILDSAEGGRKSGGPSGCGKGLDEIECEKPGKEMEGDDNLKGMDKGKDNTSASRPSSHLRTLVMSSAICMIIGEAQKRELIREILIEAASEGAGAGGGP